MKDVVPALKTNSEGLKKVLEDLVKQYNSKQQDMEKWKVCLDIWVMDSRRKQTDNTLCRRRTTSRLFSNNGFGSGSGVWEKEGWQEIHSAFQSFPSLTEAFPCSQGLRVGDMPKDRIHTQSRISSSLPSRRPGITKISTYITRRCTTSQASYLRPRRLGWMCCTAAKRGPRLFDGRFQRLEAQRDSLVPCLGALSLKAAHIERS